MLRSLAVVASALAILYGAPFALADSLEDIEHVVFFMQENRSWDSYFGTLKGVRGFQDPNVQINPNNRSCFYQNVNSTLSTATDYLLPYPINYKGDVNSTNINCMLAGSNSWDANHQALNEGLNDMWALDNTPTSMAHFTRGNLPVHFGIVDAFTSADMYQESVIASTNPNRVAWISGSIGVPGGNAGNYTGYGYIDNSETPGCEQMGKSTQKGSCYPLTWKTVPEYMEDAGVSWNVYQSTDNFDDNPLAHFDKFQHAATYDPTGPLASKGMRMTPLSGLDALKADAAAGTLPQVSWYIGPAELSEHPPFSPAEGAWLQKQVVDAITSSPKYNKTILVISYDETGGWGDHVVPYHSPNGTAGEWLQNPYTLNQTYSGPGFRVPFYVISPWTRGGNVFTEMADHSSQTLLLEKILAARGHPFTNKQMSPWRREHMSDLTGMFDFEHPDYSVPVLPAADDPTGIPQLEGNLVNYGLCLLSGSAIAGPTVPYGQQTEAKALAVEAGFRSVRGGLTEGRHLVLQQNGLALANSGSISAVTAPAEKETDPRIRIVLHYVGGVVQPNANFTISFPSAATASASYLTSALTLAAPTSAAQWSFKYTARGYSVQEISSGHYLTLIGSTASLQVAPTLFSIYSVTF